MNRKDIVMYFYDSDVENSCEFPKEDDFDNMNEYVFHLQCFLAKIAAAGSCLVKEEKDYAWIDFDSHYDNVLIGYDLRTSGRMDIREANIRLFNAMLFHGLKVFLLDINKDPIEYLGNGQTDDLHCVLATYSPEVVKLYEESKMNKWEGLGKLLKRREVFPIRWHDTGA